MNNNATWDQAANKRRGKQITIRGVTYPSRGEAARALNVTPQAIRWALANNRLDTVGLAKERGQRGI